MILKRALFTDVSSIRRRTVLLHSLIVFMLSGCNSVWFDPYIDLPDRNLAKTYQTSTYFPQLLQAASETESLRREASSYREQLAVGRSILSYGTFGAAAAGGIVAIYGAHRDLVIGLGVGAVSAYGASSLFASTDRIDIYAATNRALQCVVQAADAAMGTSVTLDELTSGAGIYLANRNALQSLITKPNVTWPTNLHESALNAASKYDAAIDNIATFRAMDMEFAVAANQARDVIIFAMEEKIRDTQPSVSTILNVAQGIGVSGVAFGRRVSTPAAGPVPVVAGVPPTPNEVAALVELSSRVEGAAMRINDAVTSATNRLGQLGTVCVLDLPSATPLTISQSEVTLGKDQTITLVTRGGKLPLTYTWQGATPPQSDQLEVILSAGNDVTLVGKSKLPTNSVFELLIRDSMAAPSEVLVKVKTP